MNLMLLPVVSDDIMMCSSLLFFWKNSRGPKSKCRGDVIRYRVLNGHVPNGQIPNGLKGSCSLKCSGRIFALQKVLQAYVQKVSLDLLHLGKIPGKNHFRVTKRVLLNLHFLIHIHQDDHRLQRRNANEIGRLGSLYCCPPQWDQSHADAGKGRIRLVHPGATQNAWLPSFVPRHTYRLHCLRQNDLQVRRWQCRML